MRSWSSGAPERGAIVIRACARPPSRPPSPSCAKLRSRLAPGYRLRWRPPQGPGHAAQSEPRLPALRRTERLRARAQRLVRHALLVLRDHDRRQGDRPGSSGPAQRVMHLPAMRGIGGNAKAVMISIRDIDHLVLRVTDVEAMIGFYCAVLGCTVERRRDDIGLVQLRAGRSLLDLVTVSGTLGAAGGAAPGVEGRNLDHFCFRLDTFDEAAIRRQLASAGITAGAVASRYGAEGEGPSLYVTDPEGNTVELKGPPWPDSPARDSKAASGEPPSARHRQRTRARPHAGKAIARRGNSRLPDADSPLRRPVQFPLRAAEPTRPRAQGYRRPRRTAQRPRRPAGACSRNS